MNTMERRSAGIRRGIAAMAWVGLAILMPAVASAQEDCGPMSPDFSYDGTHYGPYDYTSARDRKDHLPVVERYHFTPKVQSLIGGQNTSTAGGDLQYTLKAFPNHHRGLDLLIRLALKEQRNKPIGMDYDVDCWFDRAMRFRPADAVVHLLYGNWLLRTRRVDDALEQYGTAEEMGLEGPNLYYSMGLAYFEKKRLDESLRYAQKAYAAGSALPALREKLTKAGVWKEPEAVPSQ